MKKKINIKILSIFFFLGILLTSTYLEKICAQPSNDRFYEGDYIYGTYFKKWKNGLGYYETARFLQRSDGQFAYCLQPFVSFVNGKLQTAYDSDYATVTHMTQEQWERIELLSYYGYQYQNHTDPKWYAITQFMIWKTVDPTSNMYFTDSLDGNRIALYENEMAEIEHLISSHSVTPNFQSTNYTISLNETITISDINAILSQFTISNDENVATSISGNTLNITGKQLGSSSIILSKSDTKYGKAPIVYVDSEGQDLLVVGSYTPVIHTVYVNVVGGKIRITKVDSESGKTNAQGNASLVGAVYHVFDHNHKLVSILTIGNDSTATTDFLPYGEYTIQEATSSTGYLIDPTVYSVTINSNHTVDITVRESVIKGRIKITKVDSETNTCKAQGEASLVGAKYGIYNSKNELVETLTIGNNCTATSQFLPYGSYEVRELSASMGYQIDSNRYPVKIQRQETVSITSKETVLKGKIKVTKVDSETNICKAQGEASLVGAKYGIYNHQNQLVETLIIGKDCTATSNFLPYGHYEIRELSSSKGYYLNAEVSDIFIAESFIYRLTVKEMVIQNQFQFYKFYGNTDTGIIYAEANAQFQIINQSGEIVSTVVTDENGYAEVTLPYGTYTVKQIAGMTGYEWIMPLTIHVLEQTPVIQNIYLKDGPITARLKLLKIDSETKEHILSSNVMFKIKNQTTNEYICQTTDRVICEFQTNSDGILYTPLPLMSGNYLIEEIKAPTGYLLASVPIPFSIQESAALMVDPLYGPVIEVIFENTPVKGKLEIHKIGEQLGIKENQFFYESVNLPNVLFGLYDMDGNLVSELITDENGYAEVNDLALGTYRLKELASVSGHMVQNESYTFSLTYQDAFTPVVVQTLTIRNSLPKGDLWFQKIDAKTGQPLPNTEIKVFTEEGSCLYYGTTDENGQVYVSNLSVGKFYIEEVKSAIGYQLRKDKLFFDITQNGQLIQVQMKNNKIKGELEFMKVDKHTNQLLSETIIDIYTEDGILVRSGVTDIEGKIRFEGLDYGKYYIMEKEPKEGYTIFRGKLYFEVKEENEVVKVTMANEPVKGGLELTKVEEGTNIPLFGAIIAIYTEDGELITSGTTDQDGKVIFENLKYGKYYIVEKEPPKGYTQFEGKIHFEIAENELVAITMEDTKIIEIPDTATIQYSKFSYVGMLLLMVGLLSFTYGQFL